MVPGRPSRPVVAVLLGVAGLALLLLAWPSVTGDRSLARIAARGVIRIGYAVEAPHAFVATGGDVTGHSPEVAKKVAAALGIARIEWVQTEFSALIPELENGRFDVVAAGLFITPERARRVAFSRPLFHAGQGLLVAKGNPQRLQSYADFARRPALRCAVVAGAVEEQLLRELGVPAHRLAIVPDARTGQLAVATALADGLALTAPTVRWLASNDKRGRTEIAAPFVQPSPLQGRTFGYGAFAFRKDDRSLRAAWDGALAQLLAAPEYLQLAAPFGFGRAELPGAVTTQELVATP